MPKKSSKNKVSNDISNVDVRPTLPEIRERLPIDTGNGIEVRRILDDVVHTVISCEEPFFEEFHMNNIKLGLMAGACAVAMFAQFNPWEFPANRYLLAACCAMYGLANSVLQLIFVYIDKEYIFISEPYSVHGQSVRMKAEATFKRHQEFFTLKFEMERIDPPALNDTDGTCEVEMKHSVGRWFDFEGNFHESKFRTDVKRLLQSYKKKVDKFLADSKKRM
eukprot:g706.t1